MKAMTAAEVRKAFVDFFVERGHTHHPSDSLIPQDPTLLFTVAGMVPFKAYFTGEQKPPFSRAVTVQKCVRAGGKHNDLDEIGRTSRHLTFFEMLGNFSFGDYFKPDACAWAWEFVTDVLGLDPERLWVTVHLSDDEAEAIWRDAVGVPADGSSASARTTTGAWPMWARAGRARRSSGTRGPSTGRRRPRPRRRGALRRGLEPGVHAVRGHTRR